MPSPWLEIVAGVLIGVGVIAVVCMVRLNQDYFGWCRFYGDLLDMLDQLCTAKSLDLHSVLESLHTKIKSDDDYPIVRDMWRKGKSMQDIATFLLRHAEPVKRFDFDYRGISDDALDALLRTVAEKFASSRLGKDTVIQICIEDLSTKELVRACSRYTKKPDEIVAALNYMLECYGRNKDWKVAPVTNVRVTHGTVDDSQVTKGVTSLDPSSYLSDDSANVLPFPGKPAKPVRK